MPNIVRTVLKNFNRDLLIEAVSASALPFLQLELSGFERLNRFVGTPVTEPKQVSKIRQPDGSYVTDLAQSGEIRFQFVTELTVAEGSALDGILSAHDSTQRTVEQQRINQDKADLDALVANFPNFDSFNNTQRNNFLKVLARVVLRERRQPPF